MDESNKTVVSGSGDNFWREHLIAAGNFSGTAAEYCRQHDLNHKTFSFYKVRMGFSKPRGRPKAFVAVKPKTPEAKVALPSKESRKSIPDARWLAEFVTALLEGKLK